ncbi:MAG: ABC transporter substrate-binding protein [Actinomycetota bacterium]
MRTKKTWIRLLGLLAALALLAAACGDGGRDDSSDGGDGGGGDTETAEGALVNGEDCDPGDLSTGVSEDSIKIGSSFPQSGTFAAFAEISKGWRAYFDYINAEEDGIDGRQVEVVTEDDGYDPGRTANNANQLIDQEEVFALFNVIGTPNNLAIWDDVEERCVPNLYTGTGSPEWGNEEYAWTIGSLPAYTTETLIYADYVKENFPEARVGVLYQNDDFGKPYLDTFTDAVEGTDVEIVAEESYESSNTDVASQITSIAAEDPDVLLLATTALACPSALNAVNDANLDAQVFISGTCTSPTLVGLAEPGAADGIISTTNLKDPRDPQWADDEAMQLFLEKGAEYGDDIDLENSITAYGWTWGAVLAETIRAAAEAGEVNRLTVMEAARTLDLAEVGLLLPGLPVATGEGDKFPAETLQPMQYNEELGYYEFLGEPISFEGETATATG